MRNLMNALLLGAAASSLAVAADRDGEYLERTAEHRCRIPQGLAEPGGRREPLSDW